jgi:hypothetical protein
MKELSLSPSLERTPESKAVALRRGRILMGVGLAGFLPALATTVFVEPWRVAAVAVVFAFWLVFFVGKTLVKMNS